VGVRLLAEDAFGGELLAEAARPAGLGPQLDADPEPAAAHLADVRRRNRPQALERVSAELRRILDHPLLDQHLERLARHRGAQRIAAEGRAMVTGLEDVHQSAVG